MKDLLYSTVTIIAFLSGVVYGIVAERMAERERWNRRVRCDGGEQAVSPPPLVPTAEDLAFADKIIEQMNRNRDGAESDE